MRNMSGSCPYLALFLSLLFTIGISWDARMLLEAHLCRSGFHMQFQIHHFIVIISVEQIEEVQLLENIKQPLERPNPITTPPWSNPPGVFYQWSSMPRSGTEHWHSITSHELPTLTMTLGISWETRSTYVGPPLQNEQCLTWVLLISEWQPNRRDGPGVR